MMTIEEITKDHSLVIFDGECNLCDSSVQFIIRRDPRKVFKFMPIQHSLAQKLLKENYGNNIPDSVVLIEQSGIYCRSRAILKICSHLKWPWKLFSILRILPSFLLDPFYRLTAVVRKKIWGSKDLCSTEYLEFKDRFIED